MPELPEVEVICQGLRPHLIGRVVSAVRGSGKPLRHLVPPALMEEMLGDRMIETVSRRAKYLLIGFDDGSLLIIHLGMTGNLGLFPHCAALKVHDHVRWQLENGSELRFHDSRRFGGVWLLNPEQAAARESGFFAATGLEPFSPDCTPAHLLGLAARRCQPVKTFLMDGRTVAGIGNIYANEALFAAGIHPSRPASTLKKRDWQQLLFLIRSILSQAICCGGSTISDFINASGKSGYFQMNFQVYDRKGEPCPRCGAAIQKIAISGRATYLCPRCQRQSRARPVHI
jgi:formamidopyrimidine-DNA glycosylase